MNMDFFISELRSCKITTKQTGTFGVRDRVNADRTAHTLFIDEKCKTCGRGGIKGITARFIKPHRLTVFEAEMLFSVFHLKRKPVDYASYHKCPAGKKFIKNIANVKEAVA